MSLDNRCIHCFGLLDQNGECKNCDKNIEKIEQGNLSHLMLKTKLYDRYIIGDVIGYGGFGVTYKAWDSVLSVAVAIKEYFPNGLVNRAPGNPSVIVYSGDKIKHFDEGLSKFIEEAQNMAKFSSHSNIVNVMSFFEENNTAYIVMEYLEGLSLKEYLQNAGGKISYKEAIDIMIPIIEALQSMHEHKIIHRDVSPDNIIITVNNQIKLIDFGAARYSFTGKDKELSIIIKPGYAPPEQYRTNGKQGIFTDVYAVGSTLYHLITGKLPDESIDRIVNDDLEKPIKIIEDIPLCIDKAIMKAMAIKERIRFKSMDDFNKAINNGKKVDYPEIELKKRRRVRIIVTSLCLLIAVFASAIIFANRDIVPVSEKLIIWYPQSSDEEVAELQDTAHRNIAASFNESLSNSNINKIEIDYIPIPEEEYKKKILSSINTEDGPDIFCSDNFSDEELKFANNVQSIINDIDISEYYFLEESFGDKNEILYVPFSFTSSVMYLNFGIFNEADIEPWEQRIGYEDIYNLIDAFREKYYCSLSIHYESYDEYLCSARNTFYSNTELSYNTKQSAELLNEMMDIYNRELLISSIDEEKLFYDNEIAMFIAPLDKLSLVREKLAGYYGVLPIPGDNCIPASYTNRWSINGEKSLIIKNTAEMFIKYLFDEYPQSQLITQEQGSIPLNKNLFNEYLRNNYDLMVINDYISSIKIFSYSQEDIKEYNLNLLNEILSSEEYSFDSLTEYLEDNLN